MKKISELIIPENDAENFINRDKKQMFNELFIAKENLDLILESNKYFLIGEKGTGKTAYAVYMSNNQYKNTYSSLKYIRETEYSKFIEMKRSKNLQLSDYESVWKVLLLLIVSQEIHNVARENLFQKIKNFKSYNKIKNLIKRFSENAFDPELIQAMRLIENEKFVSEIGIDKTIAASGSLEASKTKENQNSKFNISLLKLENEFKNAIKEIKIGKNFIIFIDGIDIRPSSITQEDYIECLKGLTNAVWNLNQDFFNQLKDKKGNIIKVMILIRPDIFMAMDMQNQGTKIFNNSVVLNWLTTYKEYRQSHLFELADRILSYNQKEGKQRIGYYFDKYFPYKIKNNNSEDDAFIGFLRYSFYRARDIVTMLALIKNKCRDKNKTNFQYSDFRSILKDFSDYLFLEIRDYFKFYYRESDFNFLRDFLKKFERNIYFNRRDFDRIYNSYIKIFDDIPHFARSSDAFLQFLYELNIVGYKDDFNRMHWCFRERSLSNPLPKIVENAPQYMIHHGLHAALKIK